MPKFNVSMPIIGAVEFVVEADDEDGAMEAALEKYDKEGDSCCVVTWEFHEDERRGLVNEIERLAD